MKITNKKLISKFVDTIKSISKKDKIAIFHDTDPDGITSAALIKKSVEKLNLNVVYVNWLDRSNNEHDNKIIKELKQLGVNYVFFGDLTFYQIEGRIENFAQLGTIIVFDHHPFEKDLNSEKIIFILPNLFQEGISPSRYNTSKLVYDFFSRVIDLSEHDWICAVGIIADYAFDAWPEYLDMCFKKYGDERKPNMYDTKLGNLAKLLSYGNSIGREYLVEGYKALLVAKSPDEMKLHLPTEFHKVGDDINKIVGHYKRDADIDEDLELVFYKIDSKYGVASQVSSALSQNYEPKKTVIIIQEIENDPYIHVSARRQDWKVDCGKLMRESCTGIPNAHGGGHIPAAGAGVPDEHFAEFETNLFNNLKSGKYKRDGKGKN